MANTIKLFENDFTLAKVRSGKTKINILDRSKTPIFNGIISEIRFTDKERIQIQPTIRDVSYVVTFGQAITPLMIRAKGSIVQCDDHTVDYQDVRDLFENYAISARVTSSTNIEPLYVVIPQQKGNKKSQFSLQAYLLSVNVSQTDPNFPVFNVSLEFVKGL